MFSFLFICAKSYQSLHISNQGFYTLSMVEESYLKLDLENKTAIFYRSLSESMFTVEENKGNKRITEMDTLIKFSEGQYTLHMKKEIT